MMDLLIRGGTLIDPARGVNQEARDLWISNGKVVEAPPLEASRAARVIDARGLIVMPGGVDVHSHIAGSKVNASRALRPEERRYLAEHVSAVSDSRNNQRRPREHLDIGAVSLAL